MFFLFQRGYFHLPAVSFGGCTFFFLNLFFCLDCDWYSNKLTRDSHDQNSKEILEMKKLWLPFKYHHLLTVVIMVNLLLLSYGSALTSSCLGPPVFFMVVTFFFGMMEVPFSEIGNKNSAVNQKKFESKRKRPHSRSPVFQYKIRHSQILMYISQHPITHQIIKMYKSISSLFPSGRIIESTGFGLITNQRLF